MRFKRVLIGLLWSGLILSFITPFGGRANITAANVSNFPVRPAALPTSVLSPVLGPLRMTSSNLGITDGKWEFNQHQTGFHHSGGGIGGANDTYAWDANWYKSTDSNADLGQPVYATAEGDVVQYAGVGLPNSCNAVLIAHPDKNNPQWWSGYLHLGSYNVTVGQHVTQDTVIGNIGRACANNDHLHFVIYGGQNVSGGLVSFNAVINERSSATSCSNGSSENYRNRDGGPPIHPPGSLIKVSSSQTVYLIDSDNRKRPITSASVLAQLYNQQTDARTGTNFTNWVSTVAQDELDLYEQGGNLSAALAGNGRPFPDGKLIGYNGEVSIVTGGGMRRPFVTENTFTGLGFKFCHVVNVSAGEYNSYPVGPPVEAMALLTSSVNLSPAGPYSVGQNIAGSFTIKNVGFQSIPFSSLGIGGRLDGSAIYDLGFVSTTLAPGSSYSFNSPSRQLASAGTYNFFAAYQENNGHWAVSVPANPGVVRSRQISVTAQNYTINVSASPGAGGTVSGGGAFAAGSSRTVTATANSGYTFTNWTEGGNVVSSSSSYTFTLNSNRTLVANFSQNQTNYTISVSASPGAGGTVSGGGSFPAGSLRTVTATANSGYTFANWTESGNVVSTSSSFTFTLNSNRTLVANFSVASCTYSFSSSGMEVGPGNGGGAFLISTSSACSWSAISDSPSWLMTSSSGTGNGRIEFNFTANNSTSSRTGHINVGGQVHTVTQLGLGGAGSVHFSSPTYSANEAAGQVTITVTRSGGPGDGTVQYSTSNGTATAGSDYTSTSGTLFFNGSESSKTFTVPLLEDSAVEGNETVTLSLTNKSSSFNFGSPTTATLTLVDNDGSQPGAANSMRAVDFDGDRRTDLQVWRPSTAVWYIAYSSGGYFTQPLGAQGDEPVSGDYDGDGKADIAYWRPSTGVWTILLSSNGSVRRQAWGTQGDVPVSADFDGDRKTDYAVWRPSTGVWYVMLSLNGGYLIQTWGAQGDVPQSRDFDGDGKADLAYWRPSTGVWNMVLSSNGSVRTQAWGTQGDVAVAGDFDGDSRADLAVWRPSTGVWYVRLSSNGSYLIQTLGTQGDVPLSGDFDSDGMADRAVWRPSTGVWYAVFSSGGSYLIQTWGRQGDIPGNR